MPEGNLLLSLRDTILLNSFDTIFKSILFTSGEPFEVGCRAMEGTLPPQGRLVGFLYGHGCHGGFDMNEKQNQTLISGRRPPLEDRTDLRR